jgi:Phosphate-selective porin O and P
MPVAAPAPLAEPAPAEKAAPPEKLTIAKTGFFQPSANLQIWGVASHLGGVADNEWQSNVRIRRAELKVKGEIVPGTFAYNMMFDVARLLDFQSRESTVEDADGNEIGTVSTSQPPSGGGTSVLQDVAVTFLSEYADISLGQFKVPLSLEGVGSASKLYFPERSLVSRRYGDRRDLGVKAEKKFPLVGYTLGIFNGEGQNRLDSNDQKDVSLRLELYPLTGVTVAAVGYVALGERDLPGTKDRLEGDVKVELGGALLQAEYIRGWDRGASARLEGHGMYVLAGYTFFDQLQPVVRFGSLDPEIGEDRDGPTSPTDANDETNSYELGVNYYFKQHDAKLQLAGSFFDPEAAAGRTRFDLILAAQLAF